MENIILKVVDYKTNITVGFRGFYAIMNDFSGGSFLYLLEYWYCGRLYSWLSLVVGVEHIICFCSCLGAGCWSVGGSKLNIIISRMNRVRVQGVGGSRFNGMLNDGRGGGNKVFDEVVL